MLAIFKLMDVAAFAASVDAPASALQDLVHILQRDLHCLGGADRLDRQAGASAHFADLQGVVTGAEHGNRLTLP